MAGVRKWAKRIGFGLAASLLLVLMLAIGGRMLLQERTAEARTPIDAKAGVDDLIKVRIGGIDQWLRIRGTDKHNPVLLYLHGGPGTPMMPFAHLFQNGWEKHYTVVQWDQRGVGKTRFANDADAVDKTVDFVRMEADAHELTAYLKRRFGKERIFLLGHSWGSMLGIALARDYPHDYYAYIGVGQVVNMQENERLGYLEAVKIARGRSDKEAIADLTGIAPYPRPDGSHLGKDINILRKWQTRYGIGISRRFRENADMIMLRVAAASPDYSWRDLSYFLAEPSWPPLTEELNSFDIRRFGNRFEVPIIMLEGRHDWQTPSVLAETYLNSIEAPEKKLFWLEESAHSPMVDEPDAFARILIDEILPYARGKDAR